MLTEMPSTELIEWRAFYKIENEDQKDRRSRQDMLNRLAGKRGGRAR